jgi:anti-sigma-K factor RskA
VDTKAYIESGIIESYVLGLTSEQETVEVALLCNRHPEIKQAVEAFEASLEKAAFDNAVTPPFEIKSRLMAELDDEFIDEKDDDTIAPIVPFASNENYSAPSVKRWQYMAAASILLFLISAGLNFYYYTNYQTASDNYQALLIEKNTLQASNNIFQTKASDLSESMKLMSDTAMKVVKMKSVKKTSDLATIYWDTKTKDVYLLQNSLPQTASDKQYQLWAIVNGKPVDAGVIDECTGLCKMKNIPSAQAFAITLENKGGSPTPTLAAMYVMGGV